MALLRAPSPPPRGQEPPLGTPCDSARLQSSPALPCLCSWARFVPRRGKVGRPRATLVCPTEVQQPQAPHWWS